MDANSAYNNDNVLDFLMDADLVDLHNDTFFVHPGSLETLHYLPLSHVHH